MISTARGLGIEVDFSLPAERVIRSLDRIIEWRGKPDTIRVDNGPEYISEKLRIWAEKHKITIQHIQPGPFVGKTVHGTVF
jgi:putative transposase